MRVVPQTDLHIQTLKKLEAEFPDVSFNVKCITDYCMKIACNISVNGVIPSWLMGRQLQIINVVVNSFVRFSGVRQSLNYPWTSVIVLTLRTCTTSQS